MNIVNNYCLQRLQANTARARRLCEPRRPVLRLYSLNGRADVNRCVHLRWRLINNYRCLVDGAVLDQPVSRQGSGLSDELIRCCKYSFLVRWSSQGWSSEATKRIRALSDSIHHSAHVSTIEFFMSGAKPLNTVPTAEYLVAVKLNSCAL